MRGALAIVDLKTFFGEIKFDDRGANAAKAVYVQQVQAGQTVLIWPPEVATARPRYPDPGWAKRYPSAIDRVPDDIEAAPLGGSPVGETESSHYRSRPGVGRHGDRDQSSVVEK